jgi:small-conductance mechanosensitive channel
MEINYLKIIETFVILVMYLLLRGMSNKLIAKNLSRKLIQESRGIIIRKAIKLILITLCVALLLIIWGVNQSDLAAYIGSILTVVGVAFFAQWSILSNITSSVIIFFSHPVRIDDVVIIMEGKDYEVEGKVMDIGLFFVTLKTAEGQEITLPNNIFIQKMVKKG